jgi:hypothetical protein
VRRLQNRDSWQKIWVSRMNQDIFKPVVISNPIKTPMELCNISKRTKQKYFEYFKTQKNTSLQS